LQGKTVADAAAARQVLKMEIQFLPRVSGGTAQGGAIFPGFPGPVGELFRSARPKGNPFEP
jgi:hypothetical protein